MSHRGRKRKQKRGRKIAKAVASAPPGAPAWPEAPALLERAAAALNTLERAGITAELAHGAVITEAGYVFRVGGQWAARTRTLTEFPPETGDD